MAIVSDADASGTMGHLCGFYQSDEELIALLAQVLRPRLEKGRTVVYVADTDSEEGAWKRLDQAGLDVAAYRSSGGVEVIAARDAFWGEGPASVTSLLDFLQRKAAVGGQQGGSGTSLVSEKSWILSHGLADAQLLEYEGRVNTVLPPAAGELCCLYDQRRFQSEILLEALLTHPWVLRGSTLCPNPSYLPPADYFAPQRKWFEFERQLQRLDDQCAGAQSVFQETDIKEFCNRLPLLIHTHDAAGNYTFWNRESERVLGYTQEDVLEDAQIRTRLAPDGPCLTVSQDRADQSDPNKLTSDMECQAKDGTTRIIQFRRRIVPPELPGWSTLDAGVDVTNCRRVQEALDTSRRQLDLIIENVPARFCLIDASLRFRFVNSLYASWYGKRPEEIIGADVRDIMSAPYFEMVFPYMQRTLSGEALEFETTADFIFSVERTVRIHQSPYRSSADSIEGFVTMILDISEQKQAEKSLQESELRFRTYLEEGADAVLMTDLGGTIREVNRRATEYLGYSHEELRGMHLTNLDVRMRKKEELEAVFQNLLEDKRICIESALLRKDGALLPVEAHCSLFEFKGEMLVLAQTRDISERLRARAEREELLLRFRVIFENSIDGILVVIRQTLRFAYANPAISAMLGYQPGAFRSLHFSNLFEPQSVRNAAPETDDPVAFMLAPRSDVCLVKKDGELFYVDTTGAEAVVDGRKCIVLFIRDATKRRADEERLKRSYEFQAKLFEVSPDTIIRFDTSGRILQISPRCQELLGVEDADALIGAHIRNWMIPEEHARAAGNYERIKTLKPGESISPNRYRLRRGDNTILYGSFHSAPLFGENGKLEGVVSVLRDVTEEVEAAEKFRRTLEFQARIMEASPDAITRLDPQGRIEFVSLQGSRLLGEENPDDFLGTDARQWIDPADHARLEANIASLIQARNVRRHTTNEYRFQLRNGQTFIGAISSAPFVDDNGLVTGIVSVIRDVSEQKRMEHQLRIREKQQRELVESLHEGLEVIDRSGRILFVNRKFCELLGYSREELLGKRFIDLVPREERKSFWAQVIKRKISSVQQHEIVFPRKDGVKRIFLVTHHPRTDESGKLAGSFGVVSDITEKKQLEQMKEEVDRLIRNELRTPLKGILSLTHLMLMDKSGSRSADYATELNGIASNMLKLIDLSREIFRMEQGDYEPNFAWFDFRKIFRNINRFINPEAQINLVRVIYHNDPESGLGKLQHYGEQVLLESMLVNLIKNAVETSKDRDEVTVIFECTDQEVHISVHNYRYLSLEQQGLFFDKYSVDGKNNYSCLGRYCAKLIAEAHGGNITVESDREKGTMVSVMLPRLSPDS